MSSCTSRGYFIDNGTSCFTYDQLFFRQSCHSAQIGIFQGLGPFKVCPTEISVSEISTSEVGLRDIDIWENGAAEVGTSEIDTPKNGSAEVGFAQNRFAKVGTCKVGICEDSPSQVGFTENGSAEIGMGEIRSYSWMLFSPLVPLLNAVLKYLKLLLICHRCLLRWFIFLLDKRANPLHLRHHGDVSLKRGGISCR
ncbi:hypothetical protein KSF_074410 [Reticulibacter mediterranei]|uniref:Uncharacterized protein n=1 Tax=Reticulibacter mediterranei TaxID=2778369 RepID=A0A8J3IRR1_9CHLR|nr:hypothetical protein [Reticulibacter mediterranei]GHO97393.1 hypothetical protein KSF_074410 [Reticulibacter mediterranei]